MKKLELLLVMFMLAINVSYGQGLHVHRKDGKVIKMKVENVDSITFINEDIDEENVVDTIVVVKKDTVRIVEKDTLLVEKTDTIVKEKIIYLSEDGKPMYCFYYAKGEESNYNIPTTEAEFNSLVSQGKATKQAVSAGTFNAPSSALNCTGDERYWWVAIPKPYRVTKVWDTSESNVNLLENISNDNTKPFGLFYVETDDYYIYYHNGPFALGEAFGLTAQK